MDWACRKNVEKLNMYNLLVGKPEATKRIGRPRRRLVNNIRVDLGVVGWGDVNWIGLAQNRNKRKVLVNSLMSFWVP
jgi:hypothetical protein